MISSQRATHSSQMKMPAGPAISFFTSCCDLKQKEQYTVLVGTAPPAAAVSAWSLAASDISTSFLDVRNILTVR